MLTADARRVVEVAGGRERLGAPDGTPLVNKLGIDTPDCDVLVPTLGDGPAFGGTMPGEVVSDTLLPLS